jgi:DNA-binding FadR family transcriptional regulator
VTLAEHREIFRALEAHDARAARRAMETHLEAVVEELGRFSVEHAEVFMQG